MAHIFLDGNSNLWVDGDSNLWGDPIFIYPVENLTVCLSSRGPDIQAGGFKPDTLSSALAPKITFEKVKRPCP